MLHVIGDMNLLTEQRIFLRALRINIPEDKVTMAKQIVCKYFKTFLTFINEVYNLDNKKLYKSQNMKLFSNMHEVCLHCYKTWKLKGSSVDINCILSVY